jgi:hypothetical protein
MIIQSPNILRRFGMLTASGIHVVPEPILSMLTPAGPIIMSSVVCPGILGTPAMLGVFAEAESAFDGMLGMPVMFMWPESFAADGIPFISIEPIFARVVSPGAAGGRAPICMPGVGADFALGADLLGIGIAIVGDRFFTAERVLAIVLELAFFFNGPDEADFALAAGFFFV